MNAIPFTIRSDSPVVASPYLQGSRPLAVALWMNPFGQTPPMNNHRVGFGTISGHHRQGQAVASSAERC
ncbi:hypothetical protein GFY24_34035 [Nocardia sp. SYP-A9097]|uniref:hypothetical protein n=1 Tax=Nocardia sp. SYP-A9097 TaxID=2663237 RepID=UPI00129A63CC|nr:hypothetical protein [Nocardia sp. SYP-A9097]MRH92387.1 hypothetical protein [Nocardia sp. SYP-A9097]